MKIYEGKTCENVKKVNSSVFTLNEVKVMIHVAKDWASAIK